MLLRANQLDGSLAYELLIRFICNADVPFLDDFLDLSLRYLAGAFHGADFFEVKYWYLLACDEVIILIFEQIGV